MQIINININESNSKITSVFSQNEGGIFHHWNIKIDTESHSFYLEFLELEESQSMYDIANRTFKIIDPDLLQLQSCFINNSGIKIANEIEISFDTFELEKNSIRSTIKITFNSYLVYIETVMLFTGYNFYMMSEYTINSIIKEKKITGIGFKENRPNNIIYNYLN
jgi:hypothetical protein